MFLKFKIYALIIAVFIVYSCGDTVGGDLNASLDYSTMTTPSDVDFFIISIKDTATPPSNNVLYPSNCLSCVDFSTTDPGCTSSPSCLVIECGFDPSQAFDLNIPYNRFANDADIVVTACSIDRGTNTFIGFAQSTSMNSNQASFNLNMTDDTASNCAANIPSFCP